MKTHTQLSSDRQTSPRSMSNSDTPLPSIAQYARQVEFKTRGSVHGPIRRLVSPSGAGERLKPFVFLDAVQAPPNKGPGFGFHPHSGIATLTLLLSGGIWYEETTGATGTLSAGSV